jgi:Mg-chelatase subunit ChlD
MTAKNNKTYYLLILDRSGSMESSAKMAISSFNEQLQLIRKLNRKYTDQQLYVSLTIFNDEVSLLADREDPEKVEELSRKTYRPEGMTALHDAIGISVTKLDQKIRSEIKGELATAVVVIITDGYENASMAFDGEAIRSMIKEYESSGNWSFSYIGSTPDALEEAGKMNIQKDRAIKITGKDLKIAFRIVNESVESHMFEKQKGKSDFKLKGKKA